MKVLFYPFSLITTLILPSMAFVCETCGKSFLTSEKLRFHRVVHGEENMKCHICDKICIGKKSFNKHIKTHQTYEISVCKETIKMNSISYHNRKPIKDYKSCEFPPKKYNHYYKNVDCCQFNYVKYHLFKNCPANVKYRPGVQASG